MIDKLLLLCILRLCARICASICVRARICVCRMCLRVHAPCVHISVCALCARICAHVRARICAYVCVCLCVPTCACVCLFSVFFAPYCAFFGRSLSPVAASRSLYRFRSPPLAATHWSPVPPCHIPQNSVLELPFPAPYRKAAHQSPLSRRSAAH